MYRLELNINHQNLANEFDLFDIKLKDIENLVTSGHTPTIEFELSLYPVENIHSQNLSNFVMRYKKFIENYGSLVSSLKVYMSMFDEDDMEHDIPEAFNATNTIRQFQIGVVSFLSRLQNLEGISIYLMADPQVQCGIDYVKCLAHIVQNRPHPESIKSLELNITLMTYNTDSPIFENSLSAIHNLSKFSNLETLALEFDILRDFDAHEPLQFYPDFLRSLIASISCPENIKKFNLVLGRTYFFEDCEFHQTINNSLQGIESEIVGYITNRDLVLIDTIQKMQKLNKIKIEGGYSLYFIDQLNRVLKSLPRLNSVELNYLQYGNFASYYEILSNPNIQRFSLNYPTPILMFNYDDEWLTEHFAEQENIYIRPYLSPTEIVERLKIALTNSNLMDVSIGHHRGFKEHSQDDSMATDFLKNHFLDFLKCFNDLCLKSFFIDMPNKLMGMFGAQEGLNKVIGFFHTIPPCTTSDIHLFCAEQNQQVIISNALETIRTSRINFINTSINKYEILSNSNYDITILIDNIQTTYIKEDIKLFYYVCSLVHKMRDLSNSKTLTSGMNNLLNHFCAGIFDQILILKKIRNRNYQETYIEIFNYLTLRDILNLFQTTAGLHRHIFKLIGDNNQITTVSASI